MKDDLPENKESRNHTDSVGRITRFLPLDEFEITCIRQETTSAGRYRIYQLGVQLGEEIILLDVPDVVFLIQTGKRFYVNRGGTKAFLRTMVSTDGHLYVETKKDTAQLNNLKSLPICREVERKKTVKDAPAPVPGSEPEQEHAGQVAKLSQSGWLWLLAALALLILFGLAILFSIVPVPGLPSETLSIIAFVILLFSLASALIFRKTSREVYEHYFQRKQKGWLALISLLLLFILLLILLIPKAPSISFEPFSDKTYLDPDFSLKASASDHGFVSFKPSQDHFCSVTKEGLVHINNAGSCAVTAYSAFKPGVSAGILTFTINRKSQNLTFGTLPDRIYGDPDFPLTATADSTLPVSFTTSGACATLEDAGHILSAGSCTITAHQAGNENYLPAQDVKQSFNIGKKPQTINFTGPGDPSLGQPFISLKASVSSGLPVSFAAADPSVCATDGNVVTINGTGTCSITISQSGNENYLAAPDVMQTYHITAIQPVKKDDQVITFGSFSPTVFGSPNLALNASASSGLAVSFTASGKCSVAGVSVKITGAGSCTITAHQDGNDRYNPAAPVSQNLLIARATPVIFWGNPDEILLGTPLGPAQLFASAGAVVWNASNPYTAVPGSYQYTPGFGAVLPEGTHTLHVVFTPADKDNYTGNEATVRILVVTSPAGE